ncbi:MAG: T9SS type A sorting domain-containing protein [Sphingobacteriaceae bacterium]|nr:T9SS type A sorting domain-containing protein [Sphingobacteriaceae bacterium]
MKNKILSISFIACLFICASYTTAYKKTSGAHPGSTGAPLDQTCAQLGCHTDAQVILNAVNNNTLIFSSVDSSYIPGATYNITVQVQGSASLPTAKFGFEIGVLKDSDSLNIGQFVITDVARTQIITHSIATDLRYSVTHKTAGTTATATNFNSWVLNWTAPPVNEGNITFWYATNCTNNNGEETGDRIYLHSFQIHPDPAASVKEIADEYELKVFFDRETNNIAINYDLKGNRNVQLSVFDVAGKAIHTGTQAKQSGTQRQKINLGSNYAKGTYLVQLQINDQKVTKKLIVN